MNCSIAQTHINELIDGELSQDESTRIVSHIATCEDCTLVHAQLVESKQLFTEHVSIEIPTLSAGFDEALNRAITQDTLMELAANEHEHKPRKAKQFRIISYSSVSAIAACFIFAVIVLTFSTPSDHGEVLVRAPKIVVDLSEQSYSEPAHYALDEIFISQTTPQKPSKSPCDATMLPADCEILRHMINL